jgi:hypothetical protein
VFGSKIRRVGHIDTNNNWAERKKYCLKKVYYSLDELIAEAKDPHIRTSLATFKPAEILDFKVEPAERGWNLKKLRKIQHARLKSG